MSPIDWKTELVKIEREFNGLPPMPSAPQVHTRPAPRADSGEPASALAIWARLVLVATLAGALAFWPYAHDCGTGLYAFMGAAGMIVVGGLWVSVCTWRGRRGFAHTLSLGLVLAGLIAVGWQVLPRIGYARVDPFDPPRWECVIPQSDPIGR